MPITMNVTSDFICPWCLIGAKRLNKAIDGLPHDIEVRWLPFQLNPDMPPEGLDRKTYRSRKFGSWERSQALDAQTVAVGKANGIAFDYERMSRTPNTLAAHRLSWLAARADRQSAVVEGILSGYFTQGRDIGDLEVLAQIAGEAGLDRGAVRQFLESDAATDEVRALEALARQRGVHGVPHFDIGGTIVTGAQRADTLRRAILDAVRSKSLGTGTQSASSGYPGARHRNIDAHPEDER